MGNLSLERKSLSLCNVWSLDYCGISKEEPADPDGPLVAEAYTKTLGILS